MKMPVTVLALILLALTSAKKWREELQSLKVLEEHYRETLHKHKDGEIIEGELRSCTQSSGDGKGWLPSAALKASCIYLF